MSRSLVCKSLLLPGFRSAVALLGAGVLLLSLLVVATVGIRPELWAAGPETLGLAFASGLGTILAAIVPLVAAGVGFSLARQQGSGWQLMGMSRAGLWVHLWPVWLSLLVLALALSFLVEPVSWRIVHQVRDAPLAARSSWARVVSGEVMTLPGGGWARHAPDGSLELKTADGTWEGRAASVQPMAGLGEWKLGGVELQEVTEARGKRRWKFSSLKLRMEPERAARYHATPTSPWALRADELWSERRTSDRAQHIWHRRLAQAVAVPALALLAWFLAWPGSPRSWSHRFAAPATVLALLCFFGLTRLGDTLPVPVLGAWLPVLVVAAMLVVGSRR
ncbi:MAG: LptF/LptG family permease [Myxococcota bacterium]|nr:LptF/LptG family permease [Myxococcota bacterium]